MTTPLIGLIIIGDEILQGRREDKHFHAFKTLLSQRHLNLAWVLTLSDDPMLIERTLKQSFASSDIVFCCGGIGATPDDYTRQAVANATGYPLLRHREAAALIEQRFGETAYPHRILMADLPEHSQIIPNPINQIAGFSVQQHHFLPGFPQMAHPMAEWVLDTHYKTLSVTSQIIQKSLCLPHARESDLIPLMQIFVERYPDLKLFSLPSFANAEQPAHVELGFSGEAALVEIALKDLVQTLTQIKQSFYPL